MSKPVPKQIQDKAVQLYQSGLSSLEVGKQLGISYRTVLKILERYGLDARHQPLSDHVNVGISTVGELFRAVDWEQVQERLLEHYPDIKSTAGFLQAFQVIRFSRQTEDPDNTVVYIERVADDDGVYYDVYGITGDDPQHYCLSLTPLTEWASYRLADSVLASLSAADAAAHILWEATWYGFSDSEITAFAGYLERRGRDHDDGQTG